MKLVSNRHKKFGLAKSEIIRRPEDISQVFQNGRFWRGPGLDAVYCWKGTTLQVAFAAARRIRTAVQRNRIKRRLREAFRLEKENFPAPVRLVLVGHESILTASFTDLREALRQLAAKINAQTLDESQRKGNRN